MYAETSPGPLRVVRDFPPNFDLIRAHFPIRGRGVIYCYGRTVYNPEGINVGPQLVAHETVHSDRQGSDPAGWWEQYIHETGFRFAEEVVAHQAEYKYFLENGNRRQRRLALAAIAQRLSGPLYGRMTKLDDAKRILKAVREAAA